MQEVKSIKKISDSMQELDQLARSLVKNPEEYTSPIDKIYKVSGCYIICTENSIYVVSADIPTKHIK